MITRDVKQRSSTALTIAQPHLRVEFGITPFCRVAFHMPTCEHPRVVWCRRLLDGGSNGAASYEGGVKMMDKEASGAKKVTGCC